MDIEGYIADLEQRVYCYELAALYLDVSQYDIIHAQDVLSARAISRIIPPGVPLVTTIHGHYSRELSRSFPQLTQQADYSIYFESLELWGIVPSSLVIFPSFAIRKAYENVYRRHQDKFRVVTHGLDISPFLAQSGQAAVVEKPQNKRLLVCVARLNWEKGVDDLITALRNLNAVRDDWICWIIGGGFMYMELQQMVEAYGLQNQVIFFGERDDVPELLKQADLFVLASRQESLGFAIMEAQLAGKPVIATRVGGVPEIVEHGVSGLLSEPGNPEAISANILRVLSDESYAKMLGDNGHKSAMKRYPLREMIAKTIDVYEEACRLTSSQ